MRLTRQDLLVALSTALILAVYAAHQSGAAGWLVSSTRGATAAVLVIGVAGGRAMSRADVGTAFARSHVTLTCMIVVTLLGIAALTAAVAGLAGGSGTALAVLATLALWPAATIRHALTPIPAACEPEASPGPRTHEVIEPTAAERRPIDR